MAASSEYMKKYTENKDKYDNVQVTHPSCNLKKYNKIEGGDAK